MQATRTDFFDEAGVSDDSVPFAFFLDVVRSHGCGLMGIVVLLGRKGGRGLAVDILLDWVHE